MTEADNIPGQVFGSVWDALENTPAEAANMRLGSELMIAIQQAVAEWGMTQAEAARRLDVTQPRLNDLLRGRIGNFGLDALILLASRAGLEVRMAIARVAA
jgi:predicted XRE-type DNA-binding protein